MGAGDVIADVQHEFGRHRRLAEGAMGALDDEAFFRRAGEAVNPVALIVKHLAGNLRSRWTGFPGADGESATRDRDGEFVLREGDTRAKLMESWAEGWGALEKALAALKAEDLQRTVTIRGEGHTVQQALLRGLSHVAYHTGQILYVARLWKPDAPWLTIAPGESRNHKGAYRKS